jgi:hypothetical protein
VCGPLVVGEDFFSFVLTFFSTEAKATLWIVLDRSGKSRHKRLALYVH